MWVCFWTQFPVLLVFLNILAPFLYYLHYLIFEIIGPLTLLFFFGIDMAILNPLHFHTF